MHNLFSTFVRLPRLAQLSLDLGISILAFWGAYMLRFDGSIPEQFLLQFFMLLPVVLAFRFFLRFCFGLYLQIWRYSSLRELLDVGLAITVGSVSLLIASRLIFNTHVPWSVLALDWAINLVGYLSLRASRRLLSEVQPMSFGKGRDRKRVLLVGAGQAGNIFAKEIQQRSSQYHLIGFTDDDSHKVGSRIQGSEVLGRTDALPILAAKHEIDEIIICIPSASQTEMRRILELCHEAKVQVKTLPSLRELIAGNIELNKLREVQIEDLLGRDPVALDRQAASHYLAGRVVMITGAGGSIGSELCRQITILGPSRLLLVGKGEFSIYSIEMELREKFPHLDLVALIADVRDINRMRRIYQQYSPEVIFHAAAHKHVPLMERNPSEAIYNNILGTRVVATLADQFNAETFVLVSTDKAVNPTNVMGASKRVAEMVVQELAGRSKTRFMAVRFGNVLGSRGSVIPLFKRQIEQGGPITITHPEIIRYFMTIPEAAQLVLQAGALGQGGEVFVLDMGDPVKIVDLARDMIKLSGLEPDVDVEIKFTGLRPGEKLYEELLTAEEGTNATNHRKIFVARSEAINREKLELGLTLLQSAASEGDDMAIRRGLKALVTTYREQVIPEARSQEEAKEQA